MSTLYDGDDPIETAENAAVEFMVERTLAEVERAMVVVHAEFLAGDNSEGRRLLADIHARLAKYRPELLARAVTDLLDAAAHDRALKLSGEFEDWFATYLGRTVSPREVAQSVLDEDVCPGGHVAAESSWWRRARNAVLPSEPGVCDHCGKRLP